MEHYNNNKKRLYCNTEQGDTASVKQPHKKTKTCPSPRLQSSNSRKDIVRYSKSCPLCRRPLVDSTEPLCFTCHAYGGHFWKHSRRLLRIIGIVLNAFKNGFSDSMDVR